MCLPHIPALIDSDSPFVLFCADAHTESRILYERVKGQVQDGIDTLKTFRESDPYRGFFARTLYERNSGNDVAPTAPLNVK